MYEGQAPACTFHTNNLPLGIWPGSLPQGPCCKLGHLSAEVPAWLSPRRYLKATWYRTKIFSLFWSAGARFFYSVPTYFPDSSHQDWKKIGSPSLTWHQCSPYVFWNPLDSFVIAKDLFLDVQVSLGSLGPFLALHWVLTMGAQPLKQHRLTEREQNVK